MTDIYEESKTSNGDWYNDRLDLSDLILEEEQGEL